MNAGRGLISRSRIRNATASIFVIGAVGISVVACSEQPQASATANASTAADGRVASHGASRSASHVTLEGDSRAVAQWITSSADNQGASFLIIDKKAAMLHVFTGDGALRASSPVLLGSASGDASVPGIGEKAIADVKEHERTTPAGRFIAERGRNAKGVDVIWIDYDAALSMHRVINEVPAEQRLQRLATPNTTDNRISYGCVNVPVAFYESTIKPIFAEYRALVYILPEQRSIQDVFGIGTQTVAATTR